MKITAAILNLARELITAIILPSSTDFACAFKGFLPEVYSFVYVASLLNTECLEKMDGHKDIYVGLIYIN